ncbi:hypothetical protein FB451DRAFT_1164654 [Mycena latifolia]|nr:hypothetical protein FB451DRAFT_1164654 [Mycena latifolia]
MDSDALASHILTPCAQLRRAHVRRGGINNAPGAGCAFSFASTQQRGARNQAPSPGDQRLSAQGTPFAGNGIDAQVGTHTRREQTFTKGKFVRATVVWSANDVSGKGTNGSVAGMVEAGGIYGKCVASAEMCGICGIGVAHQNERTRKSRLSLPPPQRKAALSLNPPQPRPTPSTGANAAGSPGQTLSNDQIGRIDHMVIIVTIDLIAVVALIAFNDG